MAERKDRPAEMRGKGPTALGTVARRVTRPVFGKRGLADGAIVADWPAIVGPALARLSTPDKIGYPTGERTNGVLHLRVASGSLAVELQHLEPLVVERINGYFGYKAVGRLRLIHGPVVSSPEPLPAAARALSDDDERHLAQRLAGIQDSALRARLLALGRAILERDARIAEANPLK